MSGFYREVIRINPPQIIPPIWKEIVSYVVSLPEKEYILNEIITHACVLSSDRNHKHMFRLSKQVATEEYTYWIRCYSCRQWSWLNECDSEPHRNICIRCWCSQHWINKRDNYFLQQRLDNQYRWYILGSIIGKVFTSYYCQENNNASGYRNFTSLGFLSFVKAYHFKMTQKFKCRGCHTNFYRGALEQSAHRCHPAIKPRPVQTRNGILDDGTFGSMITTPDINCIYCGQFNDWYMHHAEFRIRFNPQLNPDDESDSDDSGFDADDFMDDYKEDESDATQLHYSITNIRQIRMSRPILILQS